MEEKRKKLKVELVKKCSENDSQILHSYKFVSEMIISKHFPIAIGQSKLLSWTHYNLLLDVSNDEARAWYADVAFTLYFISSPRRIFLCNNATHGAIHEMACSFFDFAFTFVEKKEQAGGGAGRKGASGV